MTADDALDQRLLPRIVRGTHFACPFTPPSTVTPPSLSGASLRFAIGVDGETPLVTVTDVPDANGEVSNPSGTTILVILNNVATLLLQPNVDHLWTLYVTPAGGEEYAWARGEVLVVYGAGSQ